MTHLNQVTRLKTTRCGLRVSCISWIVFRIVVDLRQVRLGLVHMTQLLINREHIIAAVRHNPGKLRHILAIISLAADSQNVVSMQEVWYSNDLRVALRQLGHWRTAVALEVLGDAHMAWDAAGLTLSQRTDRLDRLTRLCRQLLAGRMNLVTGESARHRHQTNIKLCVSLLCHARIIFCYVARCARRLDQQCACRWPHEGLGLLHGR